MLGRWADRCRRLLRPPPLLRYSRSRFRGVFATRHTLVQF